MEVAVRQIDFEAEKQAIQHVYRVFIEAYVEEDMTALRGTLDTSGSIDGSKYFTDNQHKVP